MDLHVMLLADPVEAADTLLKQIGVQGQVEKDQVVGAVTPSVQCEWNGDRVYTAPMVADLQTRYLMNPAGHRSPSMAGPAGRLSPHHTEVAD